MKRFQFKLEPLLEYRKRLEDIVNKEFHEATMRLDEEERKLLDLKETYNRYSEEIDRLKEEGTTGDEINLHYSYLSHVKDYIKEQENIIRRFKEELEDKRKRLIEATRNRKVVEIMKERSLKSYMTIARRLEQKQMDEIAGVRFCKRGGRR